MLASRTTRLDRDEDFALFQLGMTGDGLPIFRPKPCGDGLFDVCQCLLFILALRHTSRQSRTLGHNPPLLRLCERYMEDHNDMLTILVDPYNVAVRDIIYASIRAGVS
jgi:hypothetical protein